MPGRERGAGLLSTVLGLGVLLGILGLAVNVSLGLWARTTTESIGYEAARAVATAPVGADPHEARSQAELRACAALGSRCSEVSLQFLDGSGDTGFVELRVRAPGVGLLPRMVAGGGPVVAALDRTIRIRREVP